ncbi:hypothetical protein GQ457_02G042050 [Hibiscus cannabinus]
MFAASFDSKMGCLYSVFDVKKQGKTVWVVRARNWKLRGGENRLSGLLEGVSCWRLRKCENRLSGVARACVGEWKCFYMIEQWMHARDDDMMIDFTSHALWALRVVAPLSDRRVRGIEILPGSLAWGKARKQGGSILTFVQVRFLGIMVKVLNFRVVYRSWTFGFDSDIPRVTISGRFCDWTGSRGLHLLVSEPGYAIIGTVSEIQAPIAYTTIENVVLVKRLEQIGSLPLLTHISLFNVPLEAQRLMETGRQAYLTYVMKPIMREARPRDIRTVCDFWEYFRNSCLVLPPDREVEFVIETQTDSAPVSISPYSRSPKELKELKTQLQELLDRGFIRLSTSTWGTPVLFVKKKDERV